MKKIRWKAIEKINDIPIRQKFFWLYCVLVLVPMFMVYSIFFIKIQEEVALREENVVKQSMDRVISDVEYLIEGCFSIARDIAVDHEINEMINEDYLTSAAYFNVYYEKLKDQLQMYATGYNNVIKVSIYTSNLSVLNGGNVYSISDQVTDSIWYERMMSSNLEQTIVSWMDPHPLIKNNYFNRISVLRKMNEYTQFNKDMFVRIDIETNKLNNILQSAYNMDFVLTTEDNRIIASSLQDWGDFDGSEPQFENSIILTEYTLVKSVMEPTEGTHWLIYAMVPKSSLRDQINRYAGLIGLLFFISLLFSSLLIIIFSSSYNRRIQLLQKHMHKVENSDFELIDGHHGMDEIGGLIRAFNQMTLRINGLINEVFKFKIKEKDHQLQHVKAELKFLQSQMDPHFLFNTLNAILVVSSRNDYHEITDIIKYLSKTLRYLIEWDDSMVALKNELAFTEMYLQIEKFRFREKFEYTITMDPNLEQVLLPKLSIQPFVENACKHGIQATKTVGHLLINIYEEEGKAVISIKDNGIGMSQAKIDRILGQNTDEHIGVNNVLKRMKINYEDQHEFSLESEEGIGTCVTIRLPIQKNR